MTWTSSDAASAEWPRDFCVPPSSGSAKFWTHELYRGPNRQPVRIRYSRTKLESEEIAHDFLGESVVGFDMEWPFQPKDGTDVPLQKRIGLIQIAKEDTIALFHIGLHAGQTPKDILAPNLRRIIESADITKTGVGILNADFSRLRRWFDLEPRGAFELSHLHNLVRYGEKYPIKVTTRMKALTKQVEEHLGSPLFKGKVRTSNWSRPLNKDQIQYAAADAYAGIMLYHCMNAKRLSMNPVPPIPLHAETYLAMRQGMGSIIPVRLGATSKAENGISAFEFYQQASTTEDPEQPKRTGSALHSALPMDAKEDESIDSADEVEDGVELQEDAANVALGSGHQAALVPDKHNHSALEPDAMANIHQEVPALPEGTDMAMELVAVGRIGRQLLLEPRKAAVSSKVPEARRPEPIDQVTQPVKALPKPLIASLSRQPYKSTAEASKALFAQLSAHRKRVAQDKGCPAFTVAHNTLLTAIAEKCPQTDAELRKISGIGKVKAELYGPAWLAIVNDFVNGQAIVGYSSEQSLAPQPCMPTTPRSRRTNGAQATSQASGGRSRSPAILHTGISFSLENATLKDMVDHSVIVISDESDDEGSAFGSPMRSPSPSSLKRKRQGLTSSAGYRQKQRPVLPQPQFQSGSRVVDASRPTGQTHPPRTGLAEAKDTDHEISSNRAVRRSPPRDSQPGDRPPKQMFAPQAAAPRSEPQQLSCEAQILRNKLMAFNKRITPVVILSEATIDQIIRRPPQTTQELLQIPGVMPFANACARQNQCFFSFIARSTQKIAIPNS